MPCSNSSLSSHWVPGAISKGPMSSSVSTVVTLKAREVKAPFAAGLLGHGEVAVPGLVHGALQRDVEAELHDAVVRSERRGAQGTHPGMVDEVHEASDLLGVDLDVVAVRPAAYRAAGAGAGPLERPVDVLAELVGPLLE